jgi:hypothetical protein
LVVAKAVQSTIILTLAWKRVYSVAIDFLPSVPDRNLLEWKLAVKGSSFVISLHLSADVV